MNKYYIQGKSTGYYSAIIEANDQEEAENIFKETDINNLFFEESCVDLFYSEKVDSSIEEWDIPIIKNFTWVKEKQNEQNRKNHGGSNL